MKNFILKRVKSYAFCLFLGVWLANINRSEQGCLPCDEVQCTNSTNCPGKILLTNCGCCQVCAKQLKELCEGQFNINGICDDGLFCSGSSLFLPGNCVTILRYKSLGCWKDANSRAIPTLEGDPLLGTGHYSTRLDPIEKCARAANQKGYTIFAVQNGGWCASSATANATYQKYGASTACGANGRGGPYANNVYQLEIPAPASSTATKTTVTTETSEVSDVSKAAATTTDTLTSTISDSPPSTSNQPTTTAKPPTLFLTTTSAAPCYHYNIVVLCISGVIFALWRSMFCLR